MEINWFKERIGKTVIRSYDKEETEFEVTEKNHHYLWLMSEKGYKYHDKEVSRSDDDSWLEAAKPQVRIHRSNEACIACEG